MKYIPCMTKNLQLYLPHLNLQKFANSNHRYSCSYRYFTFAKLLTISILITLLLFSATIGAQSFSGIVRDSADGSGISGAVVFIPQLNLKAITNSEGKFRITPAPCGTYLVEIKMLGYATVTRQVNLKGDVTEKFTLVFSTSTQKEVVITGLGNITSVQLSPVPVDIVSHETLLHETYTNAIDAIAKEPGVDETTFGPGISKPEVNGLGFYRIVTLFDGVLQEDFQFGNEHNVMISPYSIYDAEIIRGAASLQYGSGAVGGVVNFKSEPFPQSGTVEGSIYNEYQTNNGLIGNYADIAGNNNGFVWHLEAGQIAAHCYSDPKDGYVWGTAYNNENARLTIGIEKSWGYSRLTFSAYHQINEIAEGTRTDSGRATFDIFDNNFINGQESPNRSNYFSYNPTDVLYQQIEHDVVSWQNSINLGSGRIIADIAYTQDHRAVIDTGTIARLNMWLTDIPYTLKYQITTNSGIKLTAGVNGFYEMMHNNEEPPAPYYSKVIIPNYNFLDAGGFAIAEKDFKKLTLSGGFRYDLRSETVDAMYARNFKTASQTLSADSTPGAKNLFTGASQFFNGLSGSIGGTYQLPDNSYVKLNLAKSYRAPAITELEEQRVDPSLRQYLIGDPTLKPEAGYEADLAFGCNGNDISFEADGFYNYMKNFIFLVGVNSKANPAMDSLNSGAPVFKYVASTAEIYGATGVFDIHPADTRWLELDNGLTYIYTSLPNSTPSTSHLPFTPAPRLTSEVRIKMKNRPNSVLKSNYFSFGLEKDWAQNNIYSAAFTELPSGAYVIYNAGLGTDFVSPKTGRVICTFLANVMNLTNVAYVDHLNYLQYVWTQVTPGPKPTQKSEVVTQPSQGIYDMGRNIGFKLIFPIGESSR